MLYMLMLYITVKKSIHIFVYIHYYWTTTSMYILSVCKGHHICIMS